MKRKLKTWWTKLTPEERRHLKEDANVHNMASLKTTLMEQAKQRSKGNIEPCWTCKNIARKLDLLDE